MAEAEKPTPEQLDAAEAALLFIFPDLKFRRHQITLEAAVFAFVVLRKVDLGARAAYGMFKLYPTTPIRKWSQIPKHIFNAVLAATKNKKSVKSKISLALIALQHQRNLQNHLDNPETFPCPEYHFQ